MWVRIPLFPLRNSPDNNVSKEENIYGKSRYY